MVRQRVVAVLLLVSCFLSSAGLSYAAPTNKHTVEPVIPAIGFNYDYTEEIEVDNPVTTHIIFSEVYSEPVFLDNIEAADRPVYGQRMVETLIRGTTIYWNTWNGLWDFIKSTVLWVGGLQFQERLENYLYSIITGFNPASTSQVGVKIGYAYNTYIREAQILSSPSGSWFTYYTAYKYDYFMYEETIVENPDGWNPPLYRYTSDPGSTPDRQGPSPNFFNDSELNDRAMRLYQNYCPAGWENEDSTYYPLVEARLD